MQHFSYTQLFCTRVERVGVLVKQCNLVSSLFEKTDNYEQYAWYVQYYICLYVSLYIIKPTCIVIDAAVIILK
jgi:hypothetical protein